MSGFLDSKFNKKNNMESTSANEDIPVLGREAADGYEVVDHELPSVNRRRGRSKFIDTVGFIALLLAGLAMMYFVNSNGDEPEEKPVKQKIANNLPPLEIPKPPPPEPEIIVPNTEIQQPIPIAQQPIQLQTNAVPSHNGPEEISWYDRKMTGGLVIGDQSNSSPALGAGNESVNHDGFMRTAENADMPNPLALKLKPTISPGVSANLLPNRDYLITKGTALDCALETAIDSTVPGLTTCRLTRDVYSDNGHVVLLDRGSQLVGEYQGGITAGQARIFVLWTRAKTPNGVIVALDSPGTDALGRSGHNGWVDTHFMERFGAAIMMSFIKDGFAYARAQQKQSSIVVGGDNSDQLATEILKNTVAIPPTLYINQGDHIQIMVGRDLDFSTVYSLDLKE